MVKAKDLVKQADTEFDVSGSYKDLYHSLAQMADELKTQIVALNNFESQYNALVPVINTLAGQANTAESTLASEYNNTGSGNSLYLDWGNAADAAYLLNGTTTTTAAETTAALNQYFSKVNQYNAGATALNAEITSADALFNEGDNALQPQIDSINNTINTLLGRSFFRHSTPPGHQPCPAAPLYIP